MRDFFARTTQLVSIGGAYSFQVHNQSGKGGEVSPALFQKLEKCALIWRKNVLIVVIYGYNFSFKMKFLRVSRGKTGRSFPCGAILSLVLGECLSKLPNSKKIPLPQKIPGYTPVCSMCLLSVKLKTPIIQGI